MAIPTMAADIGVMSENPEYQQMMQSLMNAPPAVRALAKLSQADAAYMTNLAQHNLIVSKLNDKKAEHKGTIDVAKAKLNIAQQEADIKKEKVDIDKTLGIGTANAYYNLRNNMAQNEINLNKSKTGVSNILGVANLGVGLYGAYNQSKLTDSMMPIYLKNR